MQEVAFGPDAGHLDPATGTPLIRGRHAGEVYDTAGVARRVDVGDVLADDRETGALRREGARGHREASKQVGHYALASSARTAGASRDCAAPRRS